MHIIYKSFHWLLLMRKNWLAEWFLSISNYLFCKYTCYLEAVALKILIWAKEIDHIWSEELTVEQNLSFKKSFLQVKLLNSDGKLNSQEDGIVMQPPLLPGMSICLLVQCSVLEVFLWVSGLTHQYVLSRLLRGNYDMTTASWYWIPNMLT